MTEHTPKHADTAAARIRNAHAKETHPSQTRFYWPETELNRQTSPNPATRNDAMVVRITYRNPDGSADRSADYWCAFAADDNSLIDAQYISAHDDVFGVAVYTPAAAENPNARPICVYYNGQGQLT